MVVMVVGGCGGGIGVVIGGRVSVMMGRFVGVVGVRMSLVVPPRFLALGFGSAVWGGVGGRGVIGVGVVLIVGEGGIVWVGDFLVCGLGGLWEGAFGLARDVFGIGCDGFWG